MECEKDLIEFVNITVLHKNIQLYYFGIAFGRFLSGILSGRLAPLKMVKIGQTLIGIAIFFLFLPLPSMTTGSVLFLMGCGIGPMYPNLLYNTPYAFGQKLSASVIAVQMTASYGSELLVPDPGKKQ